MRFAQLCVCLVLSFCWTPHGHAFQPNEANCKNTLDCAANSVVSLLPDWPPNFSRNEEPEGSGIVVADGSWIVTADHVLGPAQSARIRSRNGKILTAQILLREPLSDVAILKIPEKLKANNNFSASTVSQKACAIGNSFGLDISLTCGVVSATGVSGAGFNRVEDFVQTDAAVNPGMSGGALVDENGNLLGLLSAIFTKGSNANVGVNFAVSSRLLQVVLKDFEENGAVTLPQAGILGRPSRPQSTNGHVGFEVIRLVEGSREEVAGMKVGDIILSAGGRAIKHPAHYSAALALAEKEKELAIVLWREDRELSIGLNP